MRFNYSSGLDSSKIERKGYQKKRNFALISKMCTVDLLRQEVLKDYAKWYQFASKV
jgi:hypothetical protein